MLSAGDLWGMSRVELGGVLAAGHAIDPTALDDTAYRGVSLGLPAWVERLSWKTFQKVFHRDAGRLRGWNVRLEQTGLDGESTPMVRRGKPFTFGHFEVVALDGYRTARTVGGGLMIDYGRGGNRRFDPIGRLRDPIVAVNSGSAELLLGWSYLDLGAFRLGTPSFFSLELEGPLTHRADPPARQLALETKIEPM